MAKVLFVNHKPAQCGVYEFGKAIGNVLIWSKKHDIRYCEVDSFTGFWKEFQMVSPDIVIYNYHPATMRWIGKQFRLWSNSWFVPAIQIGIIHEVTQEFADAEKGEVFDYRIGADPTLKENPLVFRTNRLIPRFPPNPVKNDVVTIGGFGFATAGKGFERIVPAVQKEFDVAIINVNIPFAKFGDTDGTLARDISNEMRKQVTKPGIHLNITHDYLSDRKILEFLARNDLNVFLYDEQGNRGISSATDFAIAAQKPVAITRSSMFRHINRRFPQVCIENNSLKEIIQNGDISVKILYHEWSPANLLSQYDYIIEEAIRLR